MIQFIQLAEETLVSYTIGEGTTDHFTKTDSVLVYFDNLQGIAKNLIRTERYNIPKLMEDLQVFKDTVMRIFYKSDIIFAPWSIIMQVKQEESMSIKTYAAAVATVGHMITGKCLADKMANLELFENRTYRDAPLLKKRVDPTDGTSHMSIYAHYTFVNVDYMDMWVKFLSGAEKYAVATAPSPIKNSPQSKDVCKGGEKVLYLPGFDLKRPRREVMTHVAWANQANARLTAPVDGANNPRLRFSKNTGTQSNGDPQGIYDNRR